MEKIKLRHIRHSLVFKIILSVCVILLISISVWAVFNLKHYRDNFISDVLTNADNFSKTIKLGTHYAMMFNERGDIDQIIHNIGKLEDIKHIRIYNKRGQIKFSNSPKELGRTTKIKDEACYICHRSDPPLADLALKNRARIFRSPNGYRLLGIISPIYNEPGCSAAQCHAHIAGKKVLGALDVVISLQKTDQEIRHFQHRLISLAVFIFISTSAIIFFVLLIYFINPVKRLISGTRRIAKGEYDALKDFAHGDEIGYLGRAINQMGHEIGNKQAELQKQKDGYQTLFELVPCIITVQDQDYKLTQYNQEFSDRFAPRIGDYCFSAYKGRSSKCENCPVEKTFKDGECHYSEETGISKDGSETHWIVKTAPMKNKSGEVIAAMEMSLDITHLKKLEEKLKKSEEKYYAIFNNIPNPVFVLDGNTLEVLDCNESVSSEYGFQKQDVVNRSFLDLFIDDEKERYAQQIKDSYEINRAKHINKQGKTLYVNIRISPSEHFGRKVFLVTTMDVTKRLDAELQLVQAGKMATLGEMATGVAHELNQPLSVIKTASSFFVKKINRKEKIPDDILQTMAEEINRHVDRAANIINHLRQFGRKSEITLQKVNVNEVLHRAFEMFRQQLKLREIDVKWEIDENLPPVLAEQSRLEQVFINLLINARDAIEEKSSAEIPAGKKDKKILIKTLADKNEVLIKIEDNGIGMPKKILTKIFEPFFTTKKIGEGTGIGLSISYRIIQEFNGRIHVASSEKEGSCFTIRLPQYQEE